MKWFTGVLLFICVYLLALLINFPVQQHLAATVPPAIQLAKTEGNLLGGTTEMSALSGTVTGSIRWSFDYTSLLNLAPAFELSGNLDEAELNAKLVTNLLLSDPVLHNTKAYLSLSNLSSTQRLPVDLRGEVVLALDPLVINENSCESLNGTLHINNLNSSDLPVVAKIGNVTSSVLCNNNTLALDSRFSGGALSGYSRLQLSDNNRYTHNLQLHTSLQELQALLNPVAGPPSSSGTYRKSYRGALDKLYSNL